MKLAIVGTGYVGLVTGTCFADHGHQVTCLDIDQRKVERLGAGDIPLYEPGLTEMVRRNAAAGRLQFTTSYAKAVPDADCVFVAVGTPQADDGSANLTGLWSVIESLSEHLRDATLVAIKSTVPVGTNREAARRLRARTGRNVMVASNPEFLKEGTAIQDFNVPDRVVVGAPDDVAHQRLLELYRPFLDSESQFLTMNWESAEMTKYVANCMLATKISFINEMANVCEAVGADVRDVRHGIGLDQRIGFAFLSAGAGYGGSCFPKDVRALAAVADRAGVPTRLLRSVDEVNNAQKEVLFEKIDRFFGGQLEGRTVAVWGLAFKPGTDDIREAPALVLITRLLAAGADVQAHDPVAQDNVRAIFGDRIRYAATQADALRGADALAIVTDWQCYAQGDLNAARELLAQPVIFDGRNLFDVQEMAAAGFYYSGIGLPATDGRQPSRQPCEPTSIV